MRWTTKRVDKKFLDSIFYLRWSNTDFEISDFKHFTISPGSLRYTYRVDDYLPTYPDLFHVYDNDEHRIVDHQESTEKFTFNTQGIIALIENSVPLAK